MHLFASKSSHVRNNENISPSENFSRMIFRFPSFPECRHPVQEVRGGGRAGGGGEGAKCFKGRLTTNTYTKQLIGTLSLAISKTTDALCLLLDASWIICVSLLAHRAHSRLFYRNALYKSAYLHMFDTESALYLCAFAALLWCACVQILVAVIITATSIWIGKSRQFALYLGVLDYGE